MFCVHDHICESVCQFLGGTRIATDHKLKVTAYLKGLVTEECDSGFLKLVTKYHKCLNLDVQYVKKI